MRQITMEDPGTFAVRFAYDPTLIYGSANIPGVKRIPGARFKNGGDPRWLVPAGSTRQVRLFAEVHHFALDAAASEAMEGHIKRLERNEQVSAAADADFDVPGLGVTLMPFQRAGVHYAVENKRVIIADQMGLGKTIQALATIQATTAFPALIICPAAMKFTWDREARRALGGIEVEIVNGKAPALTAPVVIVNYDILKKHYDRLIARPWSAIVMDEGHYIKSPKAQRTKAALGIVRANPDARVLVLTGTPVLNRPVELLPLLEAVGHRRSFGTWEQFVRRYCAAYQDRYGWNVSGASNLEELHQRLRQTCYVRRTKDQVLRELPAKTRTVVPLDIDNRKEYAEAEADVVAYVARRAVEDAEFLASIAGLTKAAQEAAKADRRADASFRAQAAEHLVRIEALKQIAARGKLAAVRAWIESILDGGEKVVVFAHHHDIQRAAMAAFPSAAHVLFSDTPEEIQAQVDRFQRDDSCRLMVASLVKGGVGLTLTAATQVAFIEFGWTPAAHDQAEDRLHRIGQTDNVTAHYLVGRGTIDEDIIELVEAKRQVVDAATDGGGSPGSSILGDLLARLQSRSG